MSNRLRFVRSILTYLALLVLVVISAGPLVNADEKRQVENVQIKPLHFALMVTRSPGDLYYEPLTRFCQAVADDLGIKLTVYYADDDRQKYAQNVELAVSRDRVDGVILQSFKGGGKKYLRIAEAFRVPLFFFNDINMMDSEDPSPYWVGDITPNGVGAGEALAEKLIASARMKGLQNASGKIEMVALEGFTSSGPSLKRVQGLQRAVKNHPDVILHQIVSANWRREEAQQIMPGLYKRYPGLVAIWAASDSMILGVEDWANQKGVKMGAQLVAGGIDWARDALVEISQEQLEVSYGGHFMEAGWAIVMLFDRLRGSQAGTDRLHLSTQMEALDRHNVNEYLGRFGGQDWSSIDFQRFSRAYTPSLQTYDFSLRALMSQFD
ncbi:MAG: ABC transporter substrate-binding protein [Hahellaceae bacterium]|nr:ABC transporter substrate-binding protein [Hahellaceae bacterium]MCP5169642.1 ABC transporter substrate-binding protein [Hahellaceae bacterium]